MKDGVGTSLCCEKHVQRDHKAADEVVEKIALKRGDEKGVYCGVGLLVAIVGLVVRLCFDRTETVAYTQCTG